jgi:hypothetical protein
MKWKSQAIYPPTRPKLRINGCVNQGNSGLCVFTFTYYIYTANRYSRTGLQLTMVLSMSSADKFSLPLAQLAVSSSPGPAATTKNIVMFEQTGTEVVCLSAQN